MHCKHLRIVLKKLLGFDDAQQTAVNQDGRHEYQQDRQTFCQRGETVGRQHEQGIDRARGVRLQHEDGAGKQVLLSKICCCC